MAGGLFPVPARWPAPVVYPWVRTSLAGKGCTQGGMYPGRVHPGYTPAIPRLWLGLALVWPRLGLGLASASPQYITEFRTGVAEKPHY